MLFIDIKNNDLGGVAVEVAEVLHGLAVDVTCRITEKLVWKVGTVRIKLLGNWSGGVERLGSEEDNLVELGEVGEEVVYTWSFDRLPALGTL